MVNQGQKQLCNVIILIITINVIFIISITTNVIIMITPGPRGLSASLKNLKDEKLQAKRDFFNEVL